jgi:hypothetical protein
MAEKPKANPPPPQDSGEGHMRVRDWEEFKRLVREKKPGSIVYVLEQNGFAANKEVTVLRLIMLHDKRYYIFIDLPQRDALRQTGIALRKDKNGNRYLEEDDVRAYLKAQFEGENLQFFYFWTA